MSQKLSYEEQQQRLEDGRVRERRVLDARHKAEIQEFEDGYEAKRKLLEEIWSDSSNDPTPPSNNGLVDKRSQGNTVVSNGSDVRPRSGDSVAYTAVRRRSISDEVMIILDAMRDEVEEDEIVTQITVRERYIEKFPGTDGVNLRSRISHTLKQASEGNGPLELIEKGAGSEPSKYRFRQKRERTGLLEP